MRTTRRWARPLTGILLAAGVALGALSMIEDVALHVPAPLVVEDVARLVLWGLALALIAAQLHGVRRSSSRLTRELDATRAHLSALRRGLSDGIERQLDAWALTPSEREVAQLLLKGLGHRQIAELRSTSEKTVRQQAASVYRKAGVSSRAELSAYFLEDLLVLEPSLA